MLFILLTEFCITSAASLPLFFFFHACVCVYDTGCVLTIFADQSLESLFGCNVHCLLLGSGHSLKHLIIDRNLYGEVG